jgi:hypothetical protein
MRKHRNVTPLTIGMAFVLVAGQAHAAPPIPIKFAAGSYGAVVNGKVIVGAPLTTYSLKVKAGRVLIVTFTGGGPMRGSVSCPGGVGDGPWYGTGNTITATTAGVCTITVGANTMAADWTGGFTMAVLVN